MLFECFNITILVNEIDVWKQNDKVTNYFT